MPSIALSPRGSNRGRSSHPSKNLLSTGALTEQKKPYGSACDKLKCVMWLLSGMERSEDSFVGRLVGKWEEALMASTGAGLTPWTDRTQQPSWAS